MEKPNGVVSRVGFKVVEAALDGNLRKAAVYIFQASNFGLTKVTTVLALPAHKQERHAQSHVVF
jgi:hypothetical protein